MPSRRRCMQFGAMLLALLALPREDASRGDEIPPEVREMLQRMVADAGDQVANQVQAAAGEPQDAAPRPPATVDSADVEVSSAGTVTLNVVDLPLTTVLRVLSMETNRNIVTTPAVTGTVTASLHNVTFEEALDAILLSNNAAYRAVGKFIYVYTQEELAEVLASENPPATRVFKLNHVSAEDIEPAVTPLLSAIGKVAVSTASEVGLSTSVEEAGGFSLSSSDYIVVYDRPQNLEAIARVIEELDVRPRQVLIEATILSAELNDDNALGVDFSILGGVNLELLGATSQAIQDITLGELPQTRLDDFNASAQTGFTNNVPDGGIRVGIVKDHVAVFVQALEQVTDTVVLANPKVLALNKQRGQVIVGRRDGFVTTTVTETQAIQTVEFLETGTQLIFRPFIGDDGFVRMELHPEDSIGGLNAANLPFEQTTEVTTNVVVHDGHTILIGGLFREVDTDARSQIPLLGDIPGLGNVFRSRNDSLQRQEVIILLTVHVVKDFDSYAKQSWDEFENLERLRVGIREGMMWHSRERLAQALYKSALEHYAAGEEDAALWDVRMSLHNNPRFMSSIKLQEELRDRREWDDDGTVTRSFIHRAIMRDRGLEEPMYDRPAPPFDVPQDATDEHDDVSADAARQGGDDDAG